MADDAANALAAIDAALAERPHADGQHLSDAAKALSCLRDRLASRHRVSAATPESRRRLEQVNAVLTIVLAVHFPLGPAPWPELEAARAWLAGLVHEGAADPP